MKYFIDEIKIRRVDTNRYYVTTFDELSDSWTGYTIKKGLEACFSIKEG